jgi:hypothetical protein
LLLLEYFVFKSGGDFQSIRTNEPVSNIKVPIL